MDENYTIPAIPLTLDRPRFLRLSLGALARAQRRLEEIKGEEVLIFDVLLSIQKAHMTNLQVLLWSALLSDDPTLTEERVGELVHFGNLRSVIQALEQCINVSQPAPEATEHHQNGDGPELDPQPNGSTGSNSGPSAGMTYGLLIESSGPSRHGSLMP